jgi:hypothetical protein
MVPDDQPARGETETERAMRLVAESADLVARTDEQLAQSRQLLSRLQSDAVKRPRPGAPEPDRS